MGRRSRGEDSSGSMTLSYNGGPILGSEATDRAFANHISQAKTQAAAPAAAPQAPTSSIGADIESQKAEIQKERAYLDAGIEASKKKAAIGYKRNARARTGNIFEEGKSSQSPYSRTLGG